jgi:hypothetical protein
VCLPALTDPTRQSREGVFCAKLLECLAGESALRRFISATIIEEMATAMYAPSPVGDPVLAAVSPLTTRLSKSLFSILPADPPSTYAEMAIIIQRLQMDCQGLYAAFGSQGMVPASKVPTLGGAFGIQQAHQVAKSFDVLVPLIGKAVKATAFPLLEERHHKILMAIGYYEATKAKHDRQVFAAIGGAVIALRVIPAKLTPLIRCITNSIKASSLRSLVGTDTDSMNIHRTRTTSIYKRDPPGPSPPSSTSVRPLERPSSRTPPTSSSRTSAPSSAKTSPARPSSLRASSRSEGS